MNETFSVRQSKFRSGEISSSLYGDTSLPSFAAALKVCKSWLPIPQGALVKRPGTKYIAAVKDSSYSPRLMRFKFSDNQSFLLEVGNGYIRFYVGGKYVTTGFILAAVGSGPAYYELATPFTTAMLPYLVFDQVGNAITVAYGGQAAGTAAIAPQDLKRTTSGTFGPWTISASPVFTPITAEPGLPVVQIGAWSSAVTYRQGDMAAQDHMLWCSLQDSNINHAPPSPPTVNSAQTGVQGNISWTPALDPAHQAMSVRWLNTAKVQDPSGVVYETFPGLVTFGTGPLSLDRIVPLVPSALSPALPAGWTLLYYRWYRANSATGAFGWIGDAVPSGSLVFNDIGQAPDYTIQPPKLTDPFLINAADSYPSVVGHFDQRRLWGGSLLLPATIILSRAGDLYNYDNLVIPGADTDAFNVLLASEVLEAIRAFMPKRRGLILTAQGEWAIAGSTGGPVSRSSVDVKRQSQWGSSWLPPLGIGTGLLFNTQKQNMIRDLYPLYGIYTDIWDGQDLTVNARHLFDYTPLVSWDFQSSPYPIVWAARNDGTLLSLTYQHAPPSFGQQLSEGVVAFAQHTTGVGTGASTDSFEWVAVVQEGSEDAVYFIVRRFINGAYVRYIERMDNPNCPALPIANQTIGNLSGGFFVSSQQLALKYIPDGRYGRFADCSSTYDGHNDALGFPASTMHIDSIANPGSTSPADYAIGSQISVVCSSAVFSAADAGASGIVLDPENTVGLGTISGRIVGFTGTGQVTAILDVALSLNQLKLWAAGFGASYNKWGISKSAFTVAQLTGVAIDSGDANLGRGLIAVSDGDVQTISSFAAGVATLQAPGLVVTIGIAYNSDISQLDAQHPSVELRNKKKNLHRVGFELASTRDMWVGKDFTHLAQWQQRSAIDAYSVLGLAVGYFEQFVTGEYSKMGGAVMRHFQPVPAIVTSILREFRLGDT